MSDIFNSLTFDDVNSLDHNVYITGESVYNAPERDVQAVEIPGRNGDYLLDKGRWKNIEVTYHCGTFGVDQTEFGSKIREFRNQLASKRGYKRLVDTYNSNEYRMGTFINPVEVDAASMKRAGEFDVVFNCKPQRWLTSGETELTMSRNQTLTNPTMFDASPLLKAEGYGTIGFNGYEINITNAVMGKIELQHSWNGAQATSANGSNGTGANYYDYVDVPTGVANSGDAITATETATVRMQATSVNIKSFGTISNVYVTDGGGTTITGAEVGVTRVNDKTIDCSFTLPAQYTLGGSSQSTTYILCFTINPLDADGVASYGSIECRVSALFYQSMSNGRIRFSTNVGAVKTNQSGLPNAVLRDYTISYINMSVRDVYVDSSVSVLGTPTYIDCELGEAYMIKNGEAISLNRYIDLGSDLPTLASGNNTITFSNTITSLKIVPRWWVI